MDGAGQGQSLSEWRTVTMVRRAREGRGNKDVCLKPSSVLEEPGLWPLSLDLAPHGCFRVRTSVQGAEQLICTLSPEPHLSFAGLEADCHAVKEGRTYVVVRIDGTV